MFCFCLSSCCLSNSKCVCACVYPSLGLVFAAVGATHVRRWQAARLRWLLGAVHLSDGGHQPHAAASLSLVAVGMTERLVVADEVGTVRQRHHHLNTPSLIHCCKLRRNKNMGVDPGRVVSS